LDKAAIARFALLLVVPAAPGIPCFLNPSPIWIFLISATAIAVLADWIRRATEQIAKRVGPAIGGALNVSFGSLAELVLALFVLSKGQANVVQAQITGSIIGTSLLGLGLAITVGSFGGRSLRFNHERASQLSTMLVLVLIALLLPTVFDLTERSVNHGQGLSLSDQELSIGVSVVLIVLYTANLIYTLVSRRDAFASEEAVDAPAGWALTTSIGVLVVAVR
jgi:Ca2+:H+ antiporter